MSASPNSMSILDLITNESMVVPLVASDKQQAIDSLMDHLAATSNLDDVEELKHLVWTRENQRSTGIGNGLAIPHGKCDSISKLVLVIGVLAEPIEFDSVDGKPVKMIALLLSPCDKIAEHIQALGDPVGINENGNVLGVLIDGRAWGRHVLDCTPAVPNWNPGWTIIQRRI